MYDQVNRRLKADEFLVALHDGKGLYFPLALRAGQPLPLGKADPTDTLLDYVLQTRRSLVFSRDRTEQMRQHGLTPPPEPMQSWLGVPLLAHDRLLGAIVVASHQPYRSFDAADMRLLTTIAANASVAIDNAQLYGEQTDQLNRLTILNRVMSVLTGTRPWRWCARSA